MNDTFFVWEPDETTDAQDLYSALLCIDCDAGDADVIRGYSPSDGIFERPGRVVDCVGGIHKDIYLSNPTTIECLMLAEFEARREAAIQRSNN